ncbi:Nitrogen regulatory PII-like isoform 1 [Hibiscus syriacus]|uniref:Nitrogen regulatory PII-like isoform 1 n=1 Tax=Hibiscus syriacus TaxID=106335 RepID=A0A6A2XQK4_HIBSY|nr:Nitrogen regulatory PII-like isoform 1 [Hibiscus syriacus]
MPLIHNIVSYHSKVNRGCNVQQARRQNSHNHRWSKASGIGEAIVRQFAIHFARMIVIADIQDELGRKEIESIGSHKCSYMHCDVTEKEQVKNLVQSTFQNHNSMPSTLSNPSVPISAHTCLRRRKLSIFDDSFGEVGEFGATAWNHRFYRNSNQNRVFELPSEECVGLMVEKEHHYFANANYLKRLQSGDLDPAARQEAIDFIRKVHGHFSFGPLCGVFINEQLGQKGKACPLPQTLPPHQSYHRKCSTFVFCTQKTRKSTIKKFGTIADRNLPKVLQEKTETK